MGSTFSERLRHGEETGMINYPMRTAQCLPVAWHQASHKNHVILASKHASITLLF